MLIGKLATKSGFSRDTIRYCEKLGLIQPDNRDCNANNYKNYSPKTLERLVQISQLKGLGFTLAEIGRLLESFENQDLPCNELPAQLDNKIELFEKKISLLQRYKRKLITVKKACDSECGNSKSLPDCFDSQNSEFV